VHAVETTPKTRFPAARVFSDTGGAELRLISCGGELNGRSYTDNIIVYAHLTGVTPSDSP
jgi:hypothetical protein